MMAMPQYTTSQKYDVIHYLREEFIKGKNDKIFTAVDDAYLASLPRGMSQLQEQAPQEKQPFARISVFKPSLLTFSKVP